MTILLSLLATSVIRLQIRTHDEDTDGYSRVQVWRSTTGEGGPYNRISSAGYTPAFLPTDFSEENVSSIDGPLRAIQGKEISFVLDEATTYFFTFPGTDPLTYAECATELNEAFPNLIQAGVLNDGRFFIKTVRVGALASLRVISSDASSMLGLEADKVVFGVDPDVVLNDNTETYIFTDYHGKGEYFYKTCFSNSAGTIQSPFSTPVQGGKQPISIDPSRLIMGYVKLISTGGGLLEGYEVLLYTSFDSTKSEDQLVLGGSRKTHTDKNGYAFFPVLRGITVDVSVPGGSLMQRVKVPTDPNLLQFDLLDPQYADKDSFAVQRVYQPYAERRNL